MASYRGRIAPTPTGYLHLGHARTFGIAAERAREAGGALILRIEDLDSDRCRKEYTEAIIEDLQELGVQWTEGPDLGGDYGPYQQSERASFYLRFWTELKRRSLIYPCWRSRKDVAQATLAPHSEDTEPIFPKEWRSTIEPGAGFENPIGVNWRMRVPDGENISFVDGKKGLYSKQAGVDFGDFLVWRKDGCPSYELAVVVDDFLMGITEVVRGEDLLLSTCRQLLIYRALEVKPPSFYHCPLVYDADGRRLAKRHDSLSLRKLREMG